MRLRMLVALVATALVASVAALTAKAVPDPPLKITPAVQLQFGTVPIGTMVIKPVTILNRSSEWVTYAGAGWPNLIYPGSGVAPFPEGFWQVDPANPYAGGSQPWDSSGCTYIAPKASCTLYFDWLPFEAGTKTSSFHIAYSGMDTGTLYTSQTITFIGTGY